MILPFKSDDNWYNITPVFHPWALDPSAMAVLRAEGLIYDAGVDVSVDFAGLPITIFSEGISLSISSFTDVFTAQPVDLVKREAVVLKVESPWSKYLTL